MNLKFRDGVIGQPRLGKYGGERKFWAAAIAGCSPDAILDFSASISPLGPPQSALAAISANLSYLSSYPDPEYRELKAVLSQAHQLPPEWILPSNGSAELLTWAGWELAKLASVVLVTPAFSDYYRALKAFNAKVVPSPLDLKAKGERLRARGFVQDVSGFSPPAPPASPAPPALFSPSLLAPS